MGQCRSSLTRAIPGSAVPKPQNNRLLLLLHQGCNGHWPGQARATPTGRGDRMSHVPSVKSLHMAPVLLQEQCPGCPATHSPCDTVLLGAGLATVLGGLAGMVTMSSAQLPAAVDTSRAGTGERKLMAFDIKQPSHAEQGQGTAAQSSWGRSVVSRLSKPDPKTLSTYQQTAQTRSVLPF